MQRKLWAIVLAIFLILYALLAISNFRFDMQNVVMGLLAASAGVLLLLDK